MKKFFILLLFFIFPSLTAEAFVVKTIFFKPTDAAVISDAKIAGLLRGVQRLYADEMERQGFGRKTFRLEEVNGNVSVHSVNGRHASHQYLDDTWENVLAELPDRFNPNTPPWKKQDDIHIIIVGGIDCVDGRKADGWCSWGAGWPHHSNRYGGNMVVAANSGHLNISVIAHELGHCFGLYHKPEGTDPDPPSLEHYEARWLDRHYHFNNRANTFTFPKTIGSPTLTAGSEMDSIKFQLQVSSDIGLHQAVVIRDPNVLVVGWDYMDGENQGTIEFQAVRWKWRSKVTVLIMDTLGNYHMKDFHVTLPEYETVVARNNEDPNDELQSVALTFNHSTPDSLTPTNSFREWDGWAGVWEKPPNGLYPSKPIDYLNFANMDTWDHWMYSHAPSRIVYDISGKNYTKFSTYFDLPNPFCGGGASVEITVLGDDAEIYNSDFLGIRDRNIRIGFDIPKGTEMLTIEVSDLHNKNCDHFVFGNPRLFYEDLVARNNEAEDFSNINVLMYTGAVSWMSLEDAKLQSQTTKRLLASKGIEAEIVETEAAVRNYMLQTTSDGNVDVLILYGTLPTSIYPSGNSQPDGSVAENWIESTDGNTILNHGDYLGYVSSGNEHNGVEALQALMDIPQITMWDFGLENNTPMIVTKDGKAVTPSLTNFQSDRAFHLDELTGDWFAEKVLASDTGTVEATRADPVIVRDGNRGRIGIVYQTFDEVNPKGEVAAELISNYLLTERVVSAEITEPVVRAETVVRIAPSAVISPAIGEPLTLSLNIKAGKGVAGYQATVAFDATALRYVSSATGDYLPAGAFFVDPIVQGNLIKLNAASLAGESNADGTLATLTFEVIAVKASTLTLSDVLLSNRSGETFLPDVENAEITQPTRLREDVNADGTVNIADLVLVASHLGETGQNAADVNGDGTVNIADLVLVASALGADASAPARLSPDVLETFSAATVKRWLTEAKLTAKQTARYQRGIRMLEQLLSALTPKETALLANYPNPFNPETWIPYQLSDASTVKITIYDAQGRIVRTLDIGHQSAGIYESRSRAAYWDGRNSIGEPVASGVYFYTLTAGDFTATRKLLIRK